VNEGTFFFGRGSMQSQWWWIVALGGWAFASAIGGGLGAVVRGQGKRIGAVERKLAAIGDAREVMKFIKDLKDEHDESIRGIFEEEGCERLGRPEIAGRVGTYPPRNPAAWLGF
jgi:hypothetical protein